MWDKTVFDFGKVKPKTKINAEFTYGGTKKIKEIKASCGCTLVDYKKGSNICKLEYTAADISNHLKREGHNEQTITKSVTVKYDDNTEEMLYIRGVVSL